MDRKLEWEVEVDVEGAVDMMNQEVRFKLAMSGRARAKGNGRGKYGRRRSLGQFSNSGFFETGARQNRMSGFGKCPFWPNLDAIRANRSC
jgi:hypothetical protein